MLAGTSRGACRAPCSAAAGRLLAAAAARPALPARRRRRHARGPTCNAAPEAAPAAAAAPGGAGAPTAPSPGAPGPLQKDARQLTALLLQLAKLEVRPHAQWLKEALSVVQAQMGTLGPSELCACMRALASWGYQPEGPLLDAVEARASEAMAEAGGGGFSTKQLSELAWTYAQLGLKHRQLLPTILSAAEAHMRDPGVRCPPEAMADLLWSAARLQHSPVPAAWLDAFFAATGDLREFTPQQMARTLWALARLQVVPPEAWREGFLAASQANLRGFDVKSISLTLWSLATLAGLGAPRPGRAWLTAFEGQAESCVKHLGAAEAATSLWALSQLTGRPPQELRLSAALRRPTLGLTQLDYELLTDIRMLRVVRSMITGAAPAQ